MPFGNDVLEELASVAESLTDLTRKHQESKKVREEANVDMPYPLPDVPSINDLEVPTHKSEVKSFGKPAQIKLMQMPPNKYQSPPPPPIPERPKEDIWLGMPTEENPNVLVCLSPSQRNYIKDIKASDTSADALLDMHKKFIERRGYHELSAEQVAAIDREKSHNLGKIVSSTELRKSTSPPPLPPPPSPHSLVESEIVANPNDDDKNNHRLLAIIRDSNQSSLSENTPKKTEQVEKLICNSVPVDKSSETGPQITEGTVKNSDKINESKIETEMSNRNFAREKFFNLNIDEDPFKAETKKRYSNIETATPFCSQLMQTTPKRYSNIETSSYESKKRVENGNVVYEFCDSNKQKYSNDDDKIDHGIQSGGGDRSNIKSDVKLESTRSTEAPQNHYENFSQIIKNSKVNTEKTAKADDFTYDEFRQRAKDSAKRAKSEFFDREKLLKDFEDISKLFKDDFFTTDNIKKNETRRVSFPDYLNKNSNVEETKYERTHKTESHTKEVKTDGKTYNIPIKLENGQTAPQETTKFFEEYKKQQEQLNKQNEQQTKQHEPTISAKHEESQSHNETFKNTTSKVRNVPITMEGSLRSPPSAPISRPESQNSYHRERTLSEKRLSSQNLDEWMKYAEDLGASSENITKPFLKEVDICMGRRGNARAPRLSASTSNLSSLSNQDLYRSQDPYSLASKRHQFTSCHSMIDQTPITPYVSPHGRRSIPREYHAKQREYIKLKEEELQAEFDRLEADRRRLIEELDQMQATNRLRKDVYHHRSCRLPTLSEEEAFRQQMHDEWLNKVAEREERRLHKIIKISKPTNELAPEVPNRNMRKSSSTADISDEFLRRVKERRSKLCLPSDSDWESGAESQPITPMQSDTKINNKPRVKVIEGQSETDFKHLPKHLREFAEFTAKMEKQHSGNNLKEESTVIKKEGVWSPTNKSQSTSIETTKTQKTIQSAPSPSTPPTPPPPPIWSPQPSPTLGRKEFRPIRFESPTLPRKYTKSQEDSTPISPPWSYIDSRPFPGYQTQSCSNLNSCGINSQQLSQTENLQKSKGPLLKGASYSEIDRPRIPKDDTPAFVRPNEVIYSLKNEYMSEPETENDRPKKMAQLGRRKFEGIGPTTKDGMPIVLRSEVKENNQHKWYKRMYNTLHKAKDDDEYVTISYKTRRGRYKSNGYMSEPEPNYDSDYSTMKYSTLDRRRIPSTGSYQDERNYGTMPNPIKSGSGSYKNQPGRIENYVPGHSSVSEKEKKEHLEQQKLSSNYAEGYLSRALKEQGYESDSNLVFRKKDEAEFAPLSPVEQKQVYRNVQAGGEPPFQGFRKPAPEKPKESPRRYIEGDVNIHYKSPIRYEYKDAIPEEELARRQAEAMKKLYQEERRRKYLQELQDMSSRRHTDNFTPSQKSPIPLNRYDDFHTDVSPKSPSSPSQSRVIARALYNFQGQTARELTFKKGDIIYIRRQIDKNWYEGEHNAMIGLLPANYVEIVTKDVRPTPKKSNEGQARAKFNFSAQSAIELSLNKGELVTLTRRVDDNWFEGKIANRKGIFPVAYVEILTDIGSDDLIHPMTTSNIKPVGAPASHSLITHPNSTPSLDTLRTNLNTEFINLTNGHPANGVLRESKKVHKTEVLHVDTNSEPIAYRALYKYRPQNNDELELQEGDIVYVLEKCDDGWFVGTSQRTGYFGTFPGNYVERV